MVKSLIGDRAGGGTLGEAAVREDIEKVRIAKIGIAQHQVVVSFGANQLAHGGIVVLRALEAGSGWSWAIR